MYSDMWDSWREACGGWIFIYLMHVRPPSFVCPFRLSSAPPAALLVAEEQQSWLSGPHSGFLRRSFVFPWSLSFTEIDLDHLHSGPCPSVLSLVFRGLSQAGRTRNTGRRVTCRHRVGMRLSGKGLREAPGECWLLPFVPTGPGSSGQVLVESLSHFRFPGPRSAASPWLEAPCSPTVTH